MKKNTCIVFVLVIILGIAFWVYNAKKVVVAPEVAPSTVSILSVVDDTSTASAISAGTKVVKWQTSAYPTDAGVNINLIRKLSDSPREFQFVRTLATDSPNDGQESWVPAPGENTGDLYIEVTCSTAYQFQLGCNTSSEPIKVN